VNIAEDGEEGVFGFRHGIICWDCLLGFTTEDTEAEKRGKKLMFLDDQECSRFNLSPLCSLCPRW
jgi:hypothetical protein